METVISYMEKRLQEYNDNIKMYRQDYELRHLINDAIAARAELVHLLDYTKKVGPISK